MKLNWHEIKMIYNVKIEILFMKEIHHTCPDLTTESEMVSGLIVLAANLSFSD